MKKITIVLALVFYSCLAMVAGDKVVYLNDKGVDPASNVTDALFGYLYDNRVTDK